MIVYANQTQLSADYDYNQRVVDEIADKIPRYSFEESMTAIYDVYDHKNEDFVDASGIDELIENIKDAFPDWNIIQQE